MLFDNFTTNALDFVSGQNGTHYTQMFNNLIKLNGITAHYVTHNEMTINSSTYETLAHTILSL